MAEKNQSSDTPTLNIFFPHKTQRYSQIASDIYKWQSVIKKTEIH